MDKPDPRVVEALLAAYPHLDFLLAETLLMMSARGTLEAHLSTPSKQITSNILVGAITVENNILEENPWSEATCPN